MKGKLEIGDIIVTVSAACRERGEERKFRVIGETVHFYVTESVKGGYIECFLKTDYHPGQGIRKVEGGRQSREAQAQDG
jgi:hypothetical protein